MNTSKKKVKIFIADDHPILKAGIKMTLKDYADYKITGEANSGEEAIKKIKKNLPDIVLMDISMPSMNGFETTKYITENYPSVKVIALSMHDSNDYILEIVRLGARGYILKDSMPEELILALKKIINNENYFSPKLHNQILKEYVKKVRKTKQSFRNSKLSERETEVLHYIVKGLSNREMASRLFVSVRTIETHRERIMKKLGVKNAAGLSRYAIEKGLVDVI